MYVKKLRIGNVELENNIVLAPMAGITDKPFRMICEKYGNLGLVCTEMASSKAIYFNDSKTKQLLDTENENVPISIQIFGSEPAIMASVAGKVEKYGDIIDINMGCPAPKVVKNGDGSKLLLNLELIGEIVNSVVKSTEKPVTVKIRKGWDSKSIVAIEAAKIIEYAGAKALTIHGRTREEYYSGKVDLEIIKKVKQSVNIPVIGNGDIKNAQDAIKMFEYTGVDGIMIGRANLGNPFITKQISYELEEKSLEQVTKDKKLEVIKEHLELAIREKGEYVGIREMRKHLCWYVRELKNSSQIRDLINKIEDKNQLVQVIEEYFQTI